LKIGGLISAIIALAVLLWSPLSLTMALSAVPQGHLMCYCCLAKGKTCTCCLIACPQSHPESGFESIDWSTDIILPYPDLSFYFPPHSDYEEAFYKPGTFYGQVPLKPPNPL
jgi:hypothetical protein